MNASEHLTVAEKYLQDARDVPEMPLAAIQHVHRYTAQATDHIEKARAIDQNATADIGGIKHTIDDLVAEALEIQGEVETKYGPTKSDVRRGIKALDAGLKYKPYRSNMHLCKAIGHLRLKQKPEAMAALDKVIELEPTHHYAHELKDGTKGVEYAQNSAGFEALTEFLTDWRMWFYCVPAVWFFWCAYQMVQGFNGYHNQTAYYFWWLASMCAAWVAYNWLREKIAS